MKVLPETYDFPFEPALNCRFIKKQGYRMTRDLIGQVRWGTAILMFDQCVNLFCDYIEGEIKYYDTARIDPPEEDVMIRNHSTKFNDRDMQYLNEENARYEKAVLEYLVGIDE